MLTSKSTRPVTPPEPAPEDDPDGSDQEASYSDSIEEYDLDDPSLTKKQRKRLKKRLKEYRRRKR